jgi:hypothetical protein
MQRNDTWVNWMGLKVPFELMLLPLIIFLEIALVTVLNIQTALIV